MKKWTLAFALAAFAGSATANYAEPEVLQRTGQWTVENDRDACHVFSQYGAGDDRVILRFSQYAPGDQFALGIFGKRVRSTGYAMVRLDFGGTGRPQLKRSIAGSGGGYPGLLFSTVRLDGAIDVPDHPAPPITPITPDQEAAATGLTVGMGYRAPFRLESGSMAAPFQAMRYCLANLVRSWGYDPDQQHTLARRVAPVGKPQNWITDADYPKRAWADRQVGVVQFRLDIDSEGRITACHVADRTEPDTFGARTCALLQQRARFAPALDAAGIAIPSYYVGTFNWLVPGVPR